MDVSPPEEETKYSWERGKRIAYKCYLCSWGQSFCDEALKSLPPCSSSCHHPLCTSACNEWRVPLHFPVFRVSTVFPWSLLQLYLSYPSLPLLQVSHLPPHMGTLWEGKPGQWSLSRSSSVCKDTHIYLPLVLLGSSQLLAVQHSCTTSLTHHSFHYAAMLSGCLNPLAIQQWICSQHYSCLFTNMPIKIPCWLVHFWCTCQIYFWWNKQEGMNRLQCCYLFFPLPPTPRSMPNQTSSGLVSTQ